MDDWGMETYKTGQELQEPVCAAMPESPQEKQGPNGMATASLVCGILAVLTSCCCYGALIFGGLSVLFAVLSRPSGRMSWLAIAGMVLSAVGIVLMVILFFVFWIPQMINPYGPFGGGVAL